LSASLRYLIGFGLLPVWLTASADTAGPRNLYQYTAVHMGLPVRVAVYTATEGAAQDAARAAFERIAALDRMMSDYRPESELRRLPTHEWTPVSNELFRTISRAVEIAKLTNGAFDPSVGPFVTVWREARNTRRLPDRATLDAARARVGWRKIQLDYARRRIRLAAPNMRLDLGGIAKGYILQEALHTLRAHGIPEALLEAGGDIVVGDAPPARDGWVIDTAGADPAFTARARRLTNAAIATSGATAQFLEVRGIRYSHVVDPRTGVGVTNGFTARVIANDGATADALATALTVLGPGGVSAIQASFPGVAVSLRKQ
jgi:thiamine biosynthesis lipoprotein